MAHHEAGNIEEMKEAAQQLSDIEVSCGFDPLRNDPMLNIGVCFAIETTIGRRWTRVDTIVREYLDEGRALNTSHPDTPLILLFAVMVSKSFSYSHQCAKEFVNFDPNKRARALTGITSDFTADTLAAWKEILSTDANCVDKCKHKKCAVVE